MPFVPMFADQIENHSVILSKNDQSKQENKNVNFNAFSTVVRNDLL